MELIWSLSHQNYKWIESDSISISITWLDNPQDHIHRFLQPDNHIIWHLPLPVPLPLIQLNPLIQLPSSRGESLHGNFNLINADTVTGYADDGARGVFLHW